MNVHTSKTDENKSKAAANNLSKYVTKAEAFQFADNRLETAAQRKLEKLMNEGTDVKQLKAVQTIIPTAVLPSSVPIQRKISEKDKAQLLGLNVVIDDEMSIEEVEEAIRRADLNEEVAVLFNEHDEIIGVEFGGKAEVSFPKAAAEGANTVTHNHPKGNSLSWGDIQSANNRPDVIEVAAITPSATFAMFVPLPKLGPEDLFKAQLVFNNISGVWPSYKGIELSRLAGAVAVSKLPGFALTIEPNLETYLTWFADISKERDPDRFVATWKAAIESGKSAKAEPTKQKANPYI